MRWGKNGSDPASLASPFYPLTNRRRAARSARRKGATKRRKSRKIRDSEADLSRPGKKNCCCEHEVAGDNQQQRMPAHRHTDSYPIRKLLLTDARRASIVSCMANHSPHLDNVFSALADPTRRAIIGRLSQGEASVGELARPFDMALPSLMKHIRVLETGGLVESEKHGRVRTCRLMPGAMKGAENWLAEQRAIWEARLDRLESYVATLEKKPPRRRRRD